MDLKNWRTLLAAFFLAFTLQGDLLGLPPRINRIVQFVSIIVLGYNAKDKVVTGGTVFQGDSPAVAVEKVEQDQLIIKDLKQSGLGSVIGISSDEKEKRS